MKTRLSRLSKMQTEDRPEGLTEKEALAEADALIRMVQKGCSDTNQARLQRAREYILEVYSEI